MIKAIRWFLSRILLALNALFPPRRVQRTPESQASVEGEIQSLRIYEFYGCPFCIKVRRTLRRLNLPIERVEVKGSETHERELVEGGGKRRVPCLRIPQDDGTFQWMYESSAIVNYLEQRFSPAEAPTEAAA